jgi:lactate permease
MFLPLLAALPIAVVLALMLGLHWGSTRAGPVGWAVALVVAFGAFGAGPKLLAYSQVKGLLLSAYVLYIVWFALALYRVVDEAGALRSISAAVARMTGDRMLQLLVLSWAFGSFLQGVTGFGVPVAIVAPLLVGLGFPAVTSVVATSIGSGWAVTFGSLGSAFYAMLAVTGLDGYGLAPASAALLGVCCVLCGLVPPWLHDGWAGLRHALPAVLAIGLAMAATQYVLAVHGAWSLAAFGGGCAGLVVAAGVARLGRYGEGDRVKQESRPESRPDPSPDPSPGPPPDPPLMPLPVAFLAYLVLVAIVMAAGMTVLGSYLDRVEIAIPFPATQTALGWENPAGPGRTLSVFGHPGALIAYACLITFVAYLWLGHYAPGAGRRILRATVRGSIAPTLGIVFLVGMAATMNESGMTFALAEGIARGAGGAFPLTAPFIGAIGAFVTGSNTNSNVLFGPLQMHTAELLGFGTPLIMAAQNAGGGVGSVFAPAKIVVGVSTVGLAGAGEEGEALRRTMVVGLAVIGVAAVVVWLGALVQARW